MAIPRVFHQIWINPSHPDLPEQYRKYRDGWLALHPNWDYRLWNLDNLPFPLHNADLHSRGAASYAQLADILRYEILYVLGGVYIDTDFECLRPIDGILDGVRGFACSESGRSLSIGILGAEPSSPLMLQCVRNIPRRLGLDSPTLETGPAFFTRMILGHGFHNDFTVFPSHWFYPYGYTELHRAGENFPDAYAVHRWAHSWTAPRRTLLRRVRQRVGRFLLGESSP